MAQIKDGSYEHKFVDPVQVGDILIKYVHGFPYGYEVVRFTRFHYYVKPLNFKEEKVDGAYDKNIYYSYTNGDYRTEFDNDDSRYKIKRGFFIGNAENILMRNRLTKYNGEWVKYFLPFT